MGESSVGEFVMGELSVGELSVRVRYQLVEVRLDIGWVG